MSSLVSASCLNPKNCLLIFDRDIEVADIGSLKIQDQEGRIKKTDKRLFARHSGYYIHKNYLYFFLPQEQISDTLALQNCTFFVVGSFNQWQKAIEWELHWKKSEQAWILKCPLYRLPQTTFAFKFVSIWGRWIEPWSDYGYVEYDEHGNRNLQVRPECSGAHWFSLKFEHELKTYEPCEVLYENQTQAVDLLPWLSSFESKNPLGAIVKEQTTYFGLFAPDVKTVHVELFKDGQETKKLPLTLQSDGVWTAEIPGNYENYYYYFTIENPDEKQIIDPYAHQLAGPKGPGVVKS